MFSLKSMTKLEELTVHAANIIKPTQTRINREKHTYRVI